MNATTCKEETEASASKRGLLPSGFEILQMGGCHLSGLGHERCPHRAISQMPTAISTPHTSRRHLSMYTIVAIHHISKSKHRRQDVDIHDSFLFRQDLCLKRRS